MIRWLTRWWKVLACFWFILYVTDWATKGTMMEMTVFLIWAGLCFPAYFLIMYFAIDDD